jgi:large subunit ribosomal protein L5
LSEQEQSNAEATASEDASEEKPKRTRKPAAAKPAAAKRAPRAKPGDDAPAETVAAKAATGDAAAPAAKKAAAGKREKSKVEARPLPRLLVRYRGEIRGQLFQEFGYTSTMQVPEIKKVIINIGLGEALTNAKAMETAPGHIAAISGQKAVITKARRSIAGFKIREGQAIGTMVTLRGRRMYEFVDRMISMALPRIRDFRGISRTAFDGNGNYSLGLREQIMFPEIDYGSVDKVRGMQIVITTSAKTDPEGFRLLELLGMPFAREGQAR